MKTRDGIEVEADKSARKGRRCYQSDGGSEWHHIVCANVELPEAGLSRCGQLCIDELEELLHHRVLTQIIRARLEQLLIHDAIRPLSAANTNQITVSGRSGATRREKRTNKKKTHQNPQNNRSVDTGCSVRHRLLEP